MTSASDVTTNVQSVRLLGSLLHLRSSFVLVIAYSLRWSKKRTAQSSMQKASSFFAHGSSASSRSIEATTLISIPRAKKAESVSASTPDARSTELDELAEALADDGADVGVVAGRVRLHLAAEPVRVRADQLAVGLAHRAQRLLAGLALGRLLEGLARLGEAALDRRDEELLLRAEEAEEVRLRDAGLAGDLVGRGAGEARARRRPRARPRGRPRGAPLRVFLSCLRAITRSKLSLTHNRCQGLRDPVELGVGQPGVQRQRERALEAGVRAGEARPGRDRRRGGAARTCRSGTGSPARGARPSPRRGGRAGSTYACQPWRSPSSTPGSATGRSREALGVAGGDALAGGEQLLEPARPAGSRRRRGCPGAGS